MASLLAQPHATHEAYTRIMSLDERERAREDQTGAGRQAIWQAPETGVKTTPVTKPQHQRTNVGATATRS